MTELVTIAIPVHKRLQFLPNALRAVMAQDYPHLDLLVSDNGGVGAPLEALIREHYDRPFRLRHAGGIPIVDHFNSLLAHARGEYFVLLCDDDEISSDFVSDLVGMLQRYPRAHVALAKPETMDAHGGNIRQFPGRWPEVLSGEDFIHAWATKSVRLMSTVTHLSRTAAARECGYAQLPRALYSDNVLLAKLALRGEVVFAQQAVFRWRLDDLHTGFGASWQEIAATCTGFFRLLETDTEFRQHAERHPESWPAVKLALVEQCASWYYFRWVERYRSRLPLTQWVRAGFAMPPIASYYRRVVETLAAEARTEVKRRLRWSGNS